MHPAFTQTANLTGVWKPTTAMTEARHAFCMVTLRDGTVLAAGGWNDRTTLATTEMYDPKTETWTRKGDMTGRRALFQMVLLNDGRVLAAGGWDSRVRGPVKSAEIYDPKRGTWAPAAELHTPRYGFKMLTLLDGSVMALGGQAASNEALRSVEIYHPQKKAWTPAAPMAAGRCRFDAIQLGGYGLVLVAGGLQEPTGGPNPFTDKSELYDPVTNSWEPTDGMGVPRGYHRICFT